MVQESEENGTADYNQNDPDDQYVRHMFYQIANLLDDAGRLLKKVFKEPIIVGRLLKGNNGRYSLGGIEFSSGSGIEFLNDQCEFPRWVSSRFEHNGNDYYIVNYPELRLQGLLVRVK
ncbi:hypothetical protein GCM10008014_00500 [Paenibacillus silvae]|uniref:DUF5348 domain-containing protein n=1 Tax=Paenibacillus silvae TaxID=1325358 RepID=A0ABQ1YX85_9BACL|nr:DUF5348 domain-containing protein [Paenibacillus silvae]GGH41151.1 hypothetical protein GCM10008014_00500 [Paenibacillus silvae]